MPQALLDQTLGNIVSQYPDATRVFDAYRLDFCCGGQQVLRDALKAQTREETESLLSDLSSLRPSGNPDVTDWREVSTDALIDHITERFHDRHRDDLPELIRLAQRIENVHGEHPQCPRGLADALSEFLRELETHMMKEERILFPMLRRMDADRVQAPISMMRFEHDRHGEELAQITQLTHDLREPEDACGSWRALYAGLRQFRHDLMEHIHLENNILFVSQHA